MSLFIAYNAQYSPKRSPGRFEHVTAFTELTSHLQPEAVGVGEAGGYRADLRKVHGYRVIQPRGAAGRCALLIRADVTVHDSGKVKLHGRRFVGRDVPGARKTGWTKARYIVWALITDPETGERCYVAVWHPVPGQSHSKRARKLLAEEADKAAAWLAGLHHPADLMGDTNGRPSLHVFDPLRKIASPAFAESFRGAPIDGHWIVGGTAKARALDGYPSDHKPVVAVVTWRTAKPEPPTSKPPKGAPVSKVAPPSPRYIPAKWHGGDQTPKKRIVIHGTVSPCGAGGARSVARYFQRTTRPASAHYVCDPGEVIQSVYDHTVAYHAPPNDDTLGVELCDPQSGRGKRWMNRAHKKMLANAAVVVARLCLAYGIPARRISVAQLKAGKHGICGHVDVSHAWHQTTHVDPGEDFPWGYFMSLVHAAVADLTGQPAEVTRGKRIDEAQRLIRKALEVADGKPGRVAKLKAVLADISRIHTKRK